MVCCVTGMVITTTQHNTTHLPLMTPGTNAYWLRRWPLHNELKFLSLNNCWMTIWSWCELCTWLSLREHLCHTQYLFVPDFPRIITSCNMHMYNPWYHFMHRKYQWTLKILEIVYEVYFAFTFRIGIIFASCAGKAQVPRSQLLGQGHGEENTTSLNVRVEILQLFFVNSSFYAQEKCKYSEIL